MRITLSQVIDQFQTGINNDYQNMAKSELQMATGKVINKPSDDPQGVIIALQAIEAQTQQQATDQYQKDTSLAQQWLDTTGTALGSTVQILNRARDLALQGANDTLNQADRASMVTEVNGLIQQSVQLGNTTYGGTYLFAGQNNLQAPFSANSADNPTTVAYSGDDGAVVRQIDTGEAVQVNTPGGAVFSPVFSALISLRDSLNNGDVAGIKSSVNSIDSAFDTVSSAQAQTGALANNMTSNTNRLSSVSIDEAQLAAINNTDIAKTATDLASEQTAYQAALNAGAKIMQTSLLDFLK